MWTIISWIILGLLAGAIAKWILPGKDPGGIIITIIIGILGALIGGYIGGRLFDIEIAAGLNWHSLIVAIAGSIILLLIYRLFKRKMGQP
ncbi:MAG: GlsB/YeaQ/YmgE family stress response membrane protein [Candidatus Dadabacteria bacterium]|nr:GlsB/YeaQ/YmgE family stress response membrane protein [Candidatus Dadabacteria bacterium]